MAEDDQRTLFGSPVDGIVKNNMGHVRNCLRQAMSLQGLQSYSDYPGVNKMLAHFRTSLTTIMQDILRHQDISLRLSDESQLEDKMELLRDYHDCIMERINSDLDDAQGLRRNSMMDLPPSAVMSVTANMSHLAANRSSSMVLLASKKVRKPQLDFDQKVDNSHKTPFMPIITDKPNSKKPLSIMLCMTREGVEFYSHPYTYELQHWVVDEGALSARLTPFAPAMPEDTPLLMVDTEEALRQTVQELSKCTHVAVDVEHHAFRSYLGLTCLIQMSSRTKDYIVDPIKLRGKLTPLNEIFTHPNITKVLHGADHDVMWLQRDCGLYLVNMFDTHLASKVLDFPQRSLAALLLNFCKIQADKRYQRADWRIRPLPSDFIEYARQDTHYLLYIHELLHNMLLDRANGETNLVKSVFDRSMELCDKRYEKPVVNKESYLALYVRSRKKFNNQQESALRDLYMWRDRIAREHDESVDFVLPRHMLLQIAEVLPKEMQGVLACCNPIPLLLKTELLNVHSIIRDARNEPLNKTLVNRTEVTATEAGSSNHCLHDLSHVDDGDHTLPCLLQQDPQDGSAQQSMFGDLFNDKKITIEIKEIPVLFGEFKDKHHRPSPVLHSVPFLSPFDRHRLYKESKGSLPVFDEPAVPLQPASKQADMEEDRVARVREHFLTLSDSPNRQPDEDRVARLFAHVKSSVASSSHSDSELSQSSDTKAVVMKTITYNDNKSNTNQSTSSDSSSDSSDSSESNDSEEDQESKEPVISETQSVPAAKDADSESDSSSDSSSESEFEDDRLVANTESLRTTEVVKNESSSSDDSSEDPDYVQPEYSYDVSLQKKRKLQTTNSNVGSVAGLEKKIKVNATSSNKISSAPQKKKLQAKKSNGQNSNKIKTAEANVFKDGPSNKSVKRKSSDSEIVPYNYDSANFKMFATGGSKGQRGRGKGRGNKRGSGRGGRR